MHMRIGDHHTLIIETYPVTVECGTLTLQEMILAGQYDYINKDITPEHFPTGDKTYEVELLVVHVLHMQEYISTRTVEILLREGQLRPANIEELIAFGAKYPNIQRKFPIISLGPSALLCHRPCVPALSRSGDKRNLKLDWSDVIWDDYCRFLAVRE